MNKVSFTSLTEANEAQPLPSALDHSAITVKLLIQFHFLWNRSYFAALWIVGQLPIWLTLREFLQLKTLQFYILLLCLTQNEFFRLQAKLALEHLFTFTVCVPRLKDHCLRLHFSFLFVWKCAIRPSIILRNRVIIYLSLPRLLAQALHRSLWERKRRGRTWVGEVLDE